jgi:hypothetical protein
VACGAPSVTIIIQTRILLGSHNSIHAMSLNQTSGLNLSQLLPRSVVFGPSLAISIDPWVCDPVGQAARSDRKSDSTLPDRAPAKPARSDVIVPSKWTAPDRSLQDVAL